LHRIRVIKDRLFTFYVVITSALALIPSLHLISVIILRGVEVLSEAGIKFLVDLPPTPLSTQVGGIAPSLLGTFMLTAIALPTTTLIAIFAAVMNNEFPNNPISRILDVTLRSFASIPTIVVSMTVYLLVVIPMGGYSAIASSIALAIIALPYAYTIISAALGQVPHTYREAAYALGMSRWMMIYKVIIPIARRMLAGGILITMARIMGETAALIFTAGRFRTGLTLSPNQPVDAIPLLIFDYALTPYPVMHKVAWGAALILLLIYLITFLSLKVLVKEVKL